MKITLTLPVNYLSLDESMTDELIEVLEHIAELIIDAYDAGYSKGFNDRGDL